MEKFCHSDLLKNDILSMKELDELQRVKFRKICNEIALTFVVQYYEQLKKWKTINDEVICFLTYFLIPGRDLELFLSKVKNSDSIAIEKEYVSLLPVWNYSKSTNYFNLSISQIKQFYKEITYSELMTLHMNNASDGG